MTHEDAREDGMSYLREQTRLYRPPDPVRLVQQEEQDAEELAEIRQAWRDKTIRIARIACYLAVAALGIWVFLEGLKIVALIG